jgi:hypothetical protein
MATNSTIYRDPPMALPALKLELEAPLEERVARLEANVEHIQKDVSEMKIDIRRLGEKIDGVDQKLTGKTDSLKDAVTALAINMEKQFAAVEKQFGALHTARAFDRVWWLLMSAALVGYALDIAIVERIPDIGQRSVIEHPARTQLPCRETRP